MSGAPGHFESLCGLLARRAGRVHCLGVCGVGMAGLARLLQSLGFDVSGCDLAAGGPLCEGLRAAGIPVAKGHDPAHLDAGFDWLIRSSAVNPECGELGAAAARGLPLFRRGEVLAALCGMYETLAVSGTHGKTTTTAMLTQILRAAGRDPAYCVGGECPALEGVAGPGDGRVLVAEADESDGTLALYAPAVLVVTNIEFDHAEHFTLADDVRACFRAAAERAGRVVYCADDPGALEVCGSLPHALGYGFSGAAGIRAADFEETAQGVRFKVVRAGADLGALALPAPGRHNALDALAACAAAFERGVDFDCAARAMAAFVPVRRRFETLADAGGIRIISDYAHHPSEIATAARNVSRMSAGRRLALFQPHRYSRTRALGPDFPPAFQGFDELVLAPVYAASEPRVDGGTHWDLYGRFRECGMKPMCAASLGQAERYFERRLRAGDVLCAVGAGDVGLIASSLGAAVRGRSLPGLDPALDWVPALRRHAGPATPIRSDEPLAGRTTFGVGGAADAFAETSSAGEAGRILRWCHARNVPAIPLGAGSNMLVSDLGVRGLVLRARGGEFNACEFDGNGLVLAGAGLRLGELVARAAERGWSGLEFLAGIPGTVGGALRMNAGAAGGEIGRVVEWVRFLDPAGEQRLAKGSDLGFVYRDCPGLRDAFVVDAALRLERGRPEDIRGRVEEQLRKRDWMRGLRSAGSVFKNPGGETAGRLLEQAGLKGVRVGGAAICERHANVIVAGAGATASDVMALMELARSAVARLRGIVLELEVRCLE